MSLTLLAASSPETWSLLWDILVLLGLALALGTLAELLGQSVIVGYLVAGTLAGPNVFGLVGTREELLQIAEIGVALLLFAIGLELSPHRLGSLGRKMVAVGSIQILATAAIGFLAARLLGQGAAAAVVLGFAVTMSSTACVLRLLADRSELESEHGRTALGVLLVQDGAVVPIMLLVGVLAAGGTAAETGVKLVLALGAAALLLGVFFLVFSVGARRLLQLPAWKRNRDLPILSAVIMATGSAWATHEAGLSPALGAFAAGVLLAASPFAPQIRADTRPLVTLMITLFFASIGMFGNPRWMMDNIGLVLAFTAAVVVGKPLVIALAARAMGQPWRYAVAAGFCLGQMGEFSFVIAAVAQSSSAGRELIDLDTFRAIVSATIVSFLLTPYLVAAAPKAGLLAERWLDRSGAGAGGPGGDGGETAETGEGKKGLARAPFPGAPAAGHEPVETVLIVGFGPAGQRVAEGLLPTHAGRLVAVDMNPQNLARARKLGLGTQLGDASQIDILEHAGLKDARAAVITLPDHAVVQHIIRICRSIAPAATVVARCRYHKFHDLLIKAGAHEVVDEEDQVGRRLAAQTRRLIAKRGETVL